MSKAIFRALSLEAVFALSMLALAACTSAQPTGNLTAAVQLKQHVENLRFRQAQVLHHAQEIAMLKQQHQQLLDKCKSDQQELSQLTAASDEALKQALAYARQAEAAKTLALKKALQDKSTQAQNLADQLAAELLITRRDIPRQLQNAGSLEKQIENVTAEKQGAEHLAQLEAQRVRGLEQTGQTSVAAGAEALDENASLRTPDDSSTLSRLLSSEALPRHAVAHSRRHKLPM